MTNSAEGTVVDSRSDDAVEADGTPHRLAVNQVVAAVVALGATTVSLALWLTDPRGGLFQLDWLSGPLLLVCLGALTCVAELVVVPMRHDDDTVEGLTLLDAVVLLNALVLPVREALSVSLGGILLAHLLARRDFVKTMYNLGVYATASTAASILVQALVHSPAGFDLWLLLGMTTATAAFVTINLVHMALLLSAISSQRPGDVIRQDASLSVMTVIGTVCLTATILVLSVTAPVLLPCAILPAAAMRYAYGATAAKQEERRRSARVLEYSQVLASGPSRTGALRALLELVEGEFEGTTSMAIFVDGSVCRLESATSTLESSPFTSEHAQLLAVPKLRLLNLPELPFGWQSGMVAPLTVEGQHIGTVVVGTAGRSRLRQRDLTTLSPLAGSLAVALQNADQMDQLVEETSKLRAVVDQASDGIVVLDRDGTVQVWSPAMTAITGVDADAAIGALLGEVLTCEDAEGQAVDPFGEGRRRLSPDSPRVSVDVRLLRADDEQRSTRFSHAGAFEDGTLVRDVVIVRDLTAEWRVQRMKSDFIATVSHELRTPLTPLKGYADMLRKRGDALSPEKRTRALDVIIDRAEHLGRLVEDLLAASTITTDQQPTHAMTAEVADLNAMVARACEDFPSAGGRVQLQTSPDPVRVECDPTRVVQVVSNMLSNALKYSAADRPVVVAVDECDGRGRLRVQDQGLGIPADQLERVFEQFHRVEDPMVMSTGGTGLGLFIARHLARTMGGDLVAESTLGVGSEFTLLLPSWTPEAQAGNSAADPTSGATAV